MDSVYAAKIYNSVEDLWIITTYFNSAGYKIKKVHYDTFAQSIAISNLHLMTIECAFGDNPFELPPSPNIIQIRAKDIMWQKERLLNLAITYLPKECKKVVWIDFDIFFENANWAVETSSLLDQYPIVQPFSRGIWLPPNTTAYLGKGKMAQSFGAVYSRDPKMAEQDASEGVLLIHGHTGFVWAARREVLESHGIYDACIIGGGDHVIAHAASGTMTAKCIERSIGLNTPHYKHFAHWAELFYKDIQGQIGYVPGSVLHLWHGHWRDRKYFSRNIELREFDFDPEKDICLSSSGCWEWASNKPEMHNWAAEHFASRREDDTAS